MEILENKTLWREALHRQSQQRHWGDGCGGFFGFFSFLGFFFFKLGLNE